VLNPASGTVLATLPDMGAADAVAAIEAADADRPDWAALPARERAGVLRRWAELMAANADRFRRSSSRKWASRWRSRGSRSARRSPMPNGSPSREGSRHGPDGYLEVKYLCMGGV